MPRFLPGLRASWEQRASICSGSRFLFSLCFQTTVLGHPATSRASRWPLLRPSQGCGSGLPCPRALPPPASAVAPGSPVAALTVPSPGGSLPPTQLPRLSLPRLHSFSQAGMEAPPCPPTSTESFGPCLLLTRRPPPLMWELQQESRWIWLNE